MAGSFDPYSTWFGIKPNEQPANHYRLLGLEVFESSRDAIEEAVASRAEFLQTMSMGDHVQAAQKLLNEVARARLCLVKPTRKETYDAALKKQLDELAAMPKGEAPKAIPMAIPVSVEVDDETALRDLENALKIRAEETKAANAARRSGAHKALKSKSGEHATLDIAEERSKLIPVIVVGALALVAAGIAVIVFSGGNSEPINDLDLNSSSSASLAAKEIEQGPLAGKLAVATVGDDKVETEKTEDKTNKVAAILDTQNTNQNSGLSKPSSPQGFINWGEPTAVSKSQGNSTDVSVRGALVEAFNAVPKGNNQPAEDVIVNGVEFKAKSFSTGESKSRLEQSLATNSGDANYDKLLSNASYENSGLSTLKIGNGKLIKGRTYEVQIWYVNDRKESDYNKRVMEFTDNLNNRIQLNDQFVIGIFNADDSGYQVLRSMGLDGVECHLNAYQLRDITTVDGKSLVPPIEKSKLASSSKKAKKASKKSAKTVPNSEANTAKTTTVSAKATETAKKTTPPPAKPKLYYPAKPLEFLTPNVTLPSLATQSPVPIDELNLGENKGLQLDLVFREKWSRTKDRFQVKSGEEPLTWLVSKSGRGKESTGVAKFLVKDGQLMFQWDPSAKNDESNNYLRNGVLRVSHNDEKKWVALRPTIGLKSLESNRNRFQFESNDYDVSFKTDLPWLPVASELEFEVLTIGRSVKTYGDKTLPGKIFFRESEKERFVWVELDGKVTQDRLSVHATLMAGNGTSRGSAKRVKKIKDFDDLIQGMQRVIALAVQEKDRISDGNRKKAAEASIAESRKVLAVTKEYKDIITKITGPPIGFQLFYRFDNQKIVVAKTGWAPRPAATFLRSVPELSGFELAYDLDLATLGKEIKYRANYANGIGKFDRVAYFIELQKKGGGDQCLFVSMDPFTDDIKKIGIPTVSKKAKFQMNVTNMNVYSTLNEKTLTQSKGVTGSIEFWPNSYGPKNVKKVKDASDKLRDFGDEIGGRGNYGSMQVHNFAEKQTLFAINNWTAGPDSDIGIGNSKGKEPDWSFAKNAKQYVKKRLRIYVRPAK